MKKAKDNFYLFGALLALHFELIFVHTLRLISRFWIEAEAPDIDLSDVEESFSSSLDFGE